MQKEMNIYKLSYAYRSLVDFEKAIEFSQLGLIIAKKTENKDLLGRGYNSLGHTYLSLGDVDVVLFVLLATS